MKQLNSFNCLHAKSETNSVVVNFPNFWQSFLKRSCLSKACAATFVLGERKDGADAIDRNVGLDIVVDVVGGKDTAWSSSSKLAIP